MTSIMRAIACLGLVLTISACEGAKAPYENYDKSIADLTTDKRQSTIGDLFAATREERTTTGNIAVNRYLWMAALDTLAFLPLNSTDPFSGVIATDWGMSGNAPDERFKVTAYVTSVDLAAQSLKVAVFREVKGEDGAWVMAAVSPETPRRIEDSILTRARQIKVEELAAKNK